MHDRPRRQRRMVSSRGLVVLRLLGYRHSFSREAWVHRIGRGRYGPVFTQVSDFDVPELAPELVSRLEAQFTTFSHLLVPPPAEERVELPKRIPDRSDRRAPVRWLHDEEYKLVYVDGRPPSRGARPTSDPAPDQVAMRPTVVPIKSSRATG